MPHDVLTPPKRVKTRRSLGLEITFVAAVVAGMFADRLALPQAADLALRGVPLALLIVAVGKPFLAGDRSAYRLFILVGFAFSLVGDVVIVLNFLGGIAAFFVAQACYVLAMGLPKHRPALQLAGFLPAAAVWIGMHQLLAPRLPQEMYVPVVAYMTVISLMLGRAAGRPLAVPGDAKTWLMFAGAALFVLSDGLIALNRWVTAVPYERQLILGTYFAAQWLISRSIPPRADIEPQG